MKRIEYDLILLNAKKTGSLVVEFEKYELFGALIERKEGCEYIEWIRKTKSIFGDDEIRIFLVDREQAKRIYKKYESFKKQGGKLK